MKPLLLTTLALAVLALPAPLVAADIYVRDDYGTIQEAIDAATDGDTVIVRDGTYTGTGNKDLDFGGKAITVRSENGPDNCIIDCEGSGRGFWFHLAETASSVVDGFTICNANTGTGGGFYCHASGPAIKNCIITLNTAADSAGGIYCYENGNPTITNCTITNNTAVGDYGGGIFCYGSSPTISNCTISGNTSAGGGGIRIYNHSNPQITNCTITNNTATGAHGGGGVSVDFGSSPAVVNCTISENSSDSQGGGIFCYESSPTITNCIMSDNTAPYGGGISCLNKGAVCEPMITNCTVSGNTADNGGGVHCRDSSPVMTNCILWANMAPLGHEIALTTVTAPCLLTVRFSDVQGGLGEAYVEPGCTLDMDASDIDTDPLLTGEGHLGAGSPCIDWCPTGPDDDIDGEIRPVDVPGVGNEGTDTYDIGADEYTPPPPPQVQDVCWDQVSESVVLTFSSLEAVDYTVETVDADAYDDGLAWADWTTVTAAGPLTTVMDDLTARPLTYDFRFYRVKRSDGSEYARQTAAVFDLPIDAAATTLYFISTPLVPDPDHNSVPDVFGEGAGAQIKRSWLMVSDLDEDRGTISRMRYNFVGEFEVIAGSAFDIEPGVGYEVYLGTGFQTQFKLRLTGYVPETSLTLPLTKKNMQAIRWMGYSMPRAIKLSELGLVEAVTPSWHPSNTARLLPPGSSGWGNYRYDTAGDFWYDVRYPGTPADPDLVPGMGIVFIRQGFNNLTDELVLPKWYLHPPNEW